MFRKKRNMCHMRDKSDTETDFNKSVTQNDAPESQKNNDDEENSSLRTEGLPELLSDTEGQRDVEETEAGTEKEKMDVLDERDSSPLWILSKEDFGPLKKYVADDDITDVDWDCDSLWIKYANRERRRIDDDEVTSGFINNFIDRVAVHESAQFNPVNKSFSAETETLRITCVHESLSTAGRCMNIRKTLPRLRFSPQQALDEKYTTMSVMAFIINCIKMRANFVFCGYPGCGKTEAAKFFSSFIDKNEKVITVEDTKEWHYKKINPGADAIEFKVKGNKDYEEAIAEALRLSPTWLMIAEARSREVEYLKEGMTTGVHCITTIHTDDVRKIPARIVNMMGTIVDKRQELDDMYTFLDIGIHLVEKKDQDGFIHREIDQICYFDRDMETGKNKCYMIVDRSRLNRDAVPERLKEKICEAIGDQDVFQSPRLLERIQQETNEEQGRSAVWADTREEDE